jgi:hypothetical protein
LIHQSAQQTKWDIDPSGLIIEVAQAPKAPSAPNMNGISAAQQRGRQTTYNRAVVRYERELASYNRNVQEYNRAIDYLNQSSEFRDLYNQLDTAKDANGKDIIFTINFIQDKKGDSSYDFSTRNIYWNPFGGLVLGNGWQIMSAAMGLVHEMGHGAQHLDGTYDAHVRGMITESQMESYNVGRYEIPIARRLGEFYRMNYGDYSGIYTMRNSTDFGRLNNHYSDNFGYYINWFNKYNYTRLNRR